MKPGSPSVRHIKAIPNQQEFDIRRASMDDMTKVAEFINSSADWYEDFLDPKDMEEHRVGDEWIQKNYFRRQFYIGYDGKTPVGSISTQNIGDYAYLGYIYLDADQVGKGYGHRLMNFAKAKSIKERKKGMILIAHPQASWATKAYLKFGFKKFLSDRSEILSWNKGALKPYYEEGFELYKYDLSDA